MATVEQLRAALPNVPASRRDFATSLVQYHERHGRWSARQQFFADQIVEQAQAAGLQAESHAADPQAAPLLEPALVAGASVVLGWFANVRRINPRGRARVTFPRGSVGHGLRLSAPSPTSRYSAADTIFVHRERDYAGRITAGVFLPAGLMGERVRADLNVVMADPLGATVSAGRATGNCCFCARELTDERSVTVGYGPICAEHYGLPWGEASPGSRVMNERAAMRGDVGNWIDVRVVVDPTTGMERQVPLVAGTPNLSRISRAELQRRVAAPAAAPLRPDLPSYEDGGPDDEDRAFM